MCSKLIFELGSFIRIVYLQLEERCRVEMEGHKQMLDKEYETLLTSFRKELEKLHVKHQQELERKVDHHLQFFSPNLS